MNVWRTSSRARATSPRALYSVFGCFTLWTSVGRETRKIYENGPHMKWLFCLLRCFCSSNGFTSWIKHAIFTKYNTRDLTNAIHRGLRASSTSRWWCLAMRLESFRLHFRHKRGRVKVSFVYGVYFDKSDNCRPVILPKHIHPCERQHRDHFAW